MTIDLVSPGGGDGSDSSDERGGSTDRGVSRRRFLQSASTVAGGIAAVPGLSAPANAADAGAGAVTATRRPTAPVAPLPVVGAGLATVRLRVNGVPHDLRIEPRVTLLDALRERLALTGTKKGCDRGQCGACTVLVDGRRINACLTLALMHEGSEITTIEGLGTPDALHPMQAAFIARDAFQCGYCTPGQICSAVAAVGELQAGTLSAASFEGRADGPGAATAARMKTIAISDAELRERMSGNLCRCGAYSNIVTAVRDIAGRSA